MARSRNSSRASFTRERPRAVFVIQPPPLPEPEEPEPPPPDPEDPEEGMFFDEEINSGLLVLI